MCGIAGYFHRHEPGDLAAVKAMCDRIRHRGPDDEGFHVEGGCAIGMRRLSIIDLDTGRQPISNEDDTVWVVFNGEIYNYRELRSELEAAGHRFRTRSDTETLVHLYEEYGEVGLSKLRGMFAFAIWDAPRQRLLLARDRFGKKPLYYAALPHGLYFASELKCFTGMDAIPFDLDREALKLYFLFGYLVDCDTPYQAIRKLPAGGWLAYDANGKVRSGRYWRLPEPARQAPPGLTYENARERIRDLFDEAVRIRLVSDVPLGAFLSGGIDSSSVVASMALQTDEPVKTFSIGFEEGSFNETEYARMVADKYKTDHHEIIVRPNSVELVERLAHAYDEPFADSSALPTFIVSEFARQHVKVVLTGDGGDELFAGYEAFFWAQQRAWMDRLPAAVRSLARAAARALPYASYGKNYLWLLSCATPFGRYLNSNFTPRLLRDRLLEPEWRTADDDSLAQPRFHDFLPRGESDPLTQALYFEATAKLTSDMLVKVDRASMANSLEARCPMLDHRLGEFAAEIPHHWKMRNGRGKAILIDALADRLPPALLNRSKMGFGVPLDIWFRTSLREFVRDRLTSSSFLGRGIVSPKFVRYLLDEHERGRRINTLQLWSMLMLELWFENSRLTSSSKAA